MIKRYTSGLYAIYFPGIRRKNIFFVLCSSLLLLASINVPAQTLDDFRTAASETKGPELIPFKDLRAEAIAIAREVDYCKPTVLKYDSKKLCAEKQNILEDMKVITDKMEALEKEAKEYPGTTPDKRRMDKLKSELQPYQKKLAEKNATIKEALEAFSRLHNARGGLREVFADTKSRLQQVKANPEKYLGKTPSAADKEKLNQYIEIILQHILREDIEHKKQEVGAANTAKILEDCYASK